MESKEKKYLKLLDGLKASNISSNITSLKNASSRIESFLNEVKIDDEDNPILKTNVEKERASLKKTLDDNISINERINNYIDFGDTFLTTINYSNKLNEENLKNIAKEYLKIANMLDDGRVTNIAIDIARTLTHKK